MRKVIIDEGDNLVFDVSSADPYKSKIASSIIQSQFDKFSSEMGVLNKNRIDKIKKFREKNMNSLSKHQK